MFRHLLCKVAFALVSSLGALFSGGSAFAEAQPLPHPGDTRLVQFIYEPNQTFTILTRPLSATHVEFAADESVEIVALGDTVSWIAVKSERHFFIKPSRPDLFTSATIITNKRAYQITLRSGPENGKWMQRVSWHYPELEMVQRVQAAKSASAAITEAAEQKKRVAAEGLSAESLSFDYDITGSARIRPVTVFDDGKFTYVRFAPGSQELPAVFTSTDGKSLALVNYIAKGDLIVVQRLSSELLLKLGADEVRIKRTAASTGSSPRAATSSSPSRSLFGGFFGGK
jgi:type IV secretion system protein TrbG